MTGIVAEPTMNGWIIRLYAGGIDQEKYVARTHSEALSIIDGMLRRQAMEFLPERVQS